MNRLPVVVEPAVVFEAPPTGHQPARIPTVRRFPLWWLGLLVLPRVQQLQVVAPVVAEERASVEVVREVRVFVDMMVLPRVSWWIPSVSSRLVPSQLDGELQY